MRKLILCITVFVVLVSCNKSRVRNLDVDEIWENYVEQSGEPDKLQSIKSIDYYYIAYRNGEAINSVKYYLRHPDTAFVYYDFFDSSVTSILNGKNGIVILDNEVYKMSEDEMLSLKESSWVFPEFHAEELGWEIELKGVKKVEKTLCYELYIYKPRSSSSEKRYISAKDFSLKKIDRQEGESLIKECIYVDGMKMPKRTLYNVDGVRFTSEMQYVKMDETQPDYVYSVNDVLDTLSVGLKEFD